MAAPQKRNRLYIAGGPGGDSISPAVHEVVAKSLGMEATCEFLRLSSIDHVMKIYRARNFAGGLVTMPHKRTIIPFLDHYDDFVKILGACNLVYLTPNGQLNGTNTDWKGVYGAILEQVPDPPRGSIGMVVGAGGASRAAVYALWEKLRCSKIYVVNRDNQEVEELLEDSHQHGDHYNPDIVHVRTVTQAQELASPSFVVCTVPDFEAVTEEEIEARDIYIEFLGRNTIQKGVVVDMCYHPLLTRNLKTAQRLGWKTVQGHTVVAHQFALQWKYWTGKDIAMDGLFELIQKLIEERGNTAFSKL